MAVDQGEQAVVLAHADIAAGGEARATLPHGDGPGRDPLTAEDLDPQHLRLGVAPVARRAAACFLCHDINSSGSDSNRADMQLGELLAMALAFLIVLASAHLEDMHLVALAAGHHRGFHAGAGHQGRTHLEFSAVADSQNLVDDDLLAYVRSNLFYFDILAGSNAILLATGLYDRVHVDPFE